MVTSRCRSLPTTMPAATLASVAACGESAAGGQAERDRRDHRVAGAGDVEHLARRVGRCSAAPSPTTSDMPSSPRVDQHRAADARAARRRAPRTTPRRRRRSRGRGGAAVPAGSASGRRRRGSAAKSRLLGSTITGLPAPRAAAMAARQDSVAQHALGVVGEHHDVDVRPAPPQDREQPAARRLAAAARLSRSARSNCWPPATKRVLTVVGPGRDR